MAAGGIRGAESRSGIPPLSVLPGLPSSGATSVLTMYGELLIITAPTFILCKTARDLVTTG